MSPTPVQGIIASARQKVEEISPQKVNGSVVSSVPLLTDAGQRLKVYSITVKDDIMQIIGAIKDKIVIIQTKVQQSLLTAQAAVWKIVKDRTVWIQDGYAYLTMAVEGQVLYIKAKVVEPLKSVALTCYNSSKARMEHVLQKLEVYYTKMQNGIASIVATIDKQKVLIQVKICAFGTDLKMKTLSTLDGARAAIDGYTSPLRTRAVSLYNGAAAKVDRIYVSIKGGIIHMKGVVGQRYLQLEARLSELPVFRHIASGLKTAKQATSQLIAKVMETVSNAYGKALDTLQRLQCTIKDGFIHITGMINDRVVYVRIKVADIAGTLQTRVQSGYASACTSIGDVCSGAKARVVYATEVTKAKAIEAGTNARSLVANPDARAAAAGAAVGGSSGGAAGLVAGGLVGAVCAVPAAFFTFGLSIPVGAAVGAGSGFCVGGSVGLVTGGTAGYKTYKNKATIASTVSSAFAKAQACKEKAIDSTSQVVGSLGGTPAA
jgi:hypothetical protein